MSNNQSAQLQAKPGKKRQSFWWLWLILILAAFAGGIILGLKLNTLPLPTEVKDRLYPVLESYIPGSTSARTPAETPKTPEPTPGPEATVAPASAETPAPAPVAEALPTSAPAPESTEAPFILLEGETPAPKSLTEGELFVSDTAVFESGTPTPAKTIGVDVALEIALRHAEIEKSEAEISGVYRTKGEAGETVYEVSFHVGELIYDYVVDALSGEILSWKLSGLSYSDTATFAADFSGNDQTEAQADAAAQELIGEERAREIAYTHAAVKKADVLGSDIRLDETDGEACYDVEFRIVDRRFDYQIDAYTGEILGFELQ